MAGAEICEPIQRVQPLKDEVHEIPCYQIQIRCLVLKLLHVYRFACKG